MSGTFGDLPIGAIATVMSIGKLVRVRKEPMWKNGSRCTNARKLDGRKGLVFIWPDVVAQDIIYPTTEETLAIQNEYGQKEAREM